MGYIAPCHLLRREVVLVAFLSEKTWTKLDFQSDAGSRLASGSSPGRCSLLQLYLIFLLYCIYE